MLNGRGPKRASPVRQVGGVLQFQILGDEQIDRAVLEKNQAEVQNHWARGPFSLRDLPKDAVVSRRFGLRQAEKVRLIDDMSGSSINQTVQVVESPQPQGSDVIAALALEIIKKKPDQNVVGKPFDMRSAYKQLLLAENSLWAAFVAIYNHEIRAPQIYQLSVAPFGATRSVYAFLRAAMSIWLIGASALSFPWTCFFDDYAIFAPDSIASATTSAVNLLFKMLGWAIAEDGSKASDFSQCLKALGIVVNLSKISDGCVLFSNTKKRVVELTKYIQSFLNADYTQKLRRRMQFADGQLFGRVGSLCVKAVAQHAVEHGGGKLSKHCKRSLQRFAESLKLAVPRLIQVAASDAWYVFTYACFEPTSDIPFWGIGGVLINSAGSFVSFFSQRLSAQDLRALGWGPSKTVIFEAELLALVIALSVWKPFIRTSLVVCYVDNNSARDVAISAAAGNSCANRLLDKLVMVEMDSRVSSGMLVCHRPPALLTSLHVLSVNSLWNKASIKLR